jgi:ABC-type transporter Mla subunit MlaD
MKGSKLFLWYCGILLCLPWAALPQEFTPIYENLNKLEDLMNESQKLTGDIQKDNENLKAALENLDELLKTQEALLAEQDQAFKAYQEISRKQSALLGKHISKSRKLTISLIVGLPLAAGLGLLSGLLINTP